MRIKQTMKVLDAKFGRYWYIACTVISRLTVKFKKVEVKLTIKRSRFTDILVYGLKSFGA